MARLKTRAAEIRAELAKLQGQLKEAQRSEEETAGKIARKSGLLDLGLSDKDLMEAFKGVVAGFQKTGGRDEAHSPLKPPKAMGQSPGEDGGPAD